MHKSIIIFLLLFVSIYAHAGVISCSDAISVGSEAKLSLHSTAQKRAQQAAEELVEKKIAIPYMDIWGEKSSPERMASLIEVYWCESPSTPLHSAYFRFYTNNKQVFK